MNVCADQRVPVHNGGDMNKVDWKPGTMIYPLPAVMVSLGATPEEYNIITIAWTGTLCSDPPMCYISVRPHRHSYEILQRTRAFVINLTTRSLAFATDWCGVRSGRQYNKFAEMGLTPGAASIVGAPIIVEAPINIECRVTDIQRLGTHDMFIAEVVNVKADAQFIDPHTGAFDLAKAEPLAFAHGQYFLLGKKIGKFGFSVEKKRKKRSSRGAGAAKKKQGGSE
jgi:flavin reductase (DIM6/NTAB) family NADH-FMN oxidoreductase RutF